MTKTKPIDQVHKWEVTITTNGKTIKYTGKRTLSEMLMGAANYLKKTKQ